MARVIQSPGVEIKEVDFTVRAATVEGTNVFLAGFADQGPVDEVLTPSSISEFEQIYGTPTNAAEQYFYHSAKSILTSPAKLYATRIPYGVSRGDGFSSWAYSALVYPVRAIVTKWIDGFNPGNSYTYAHSGYVSFDVTNPGTGCIATFLSSYPPVSPLSGTSSNITVEKTLTPGQLSAAGVYSVGLSADNATFLFGSPTHLELDAEEYQNVVTNNIGWTNYSTVTNKATSFTYENLGNAGLVVINKSQTAINGNFEGYYLGILDNNNNNPATDFNGVRNVLGIQSQEKSKGYDKFLPLPKVRLNFALSATKLGDGSSISEVMENLSEFNLGDPSFDDTISVGLFKLRKSIFTPDANTLDYTAVETYVGSVDFHRQVADQQGGPAKTFFVGENVETNSNNISMVFNPYVNSRMSGTWLNNEGTVTKKVRFLSNQVASKISAQGFNDTDETYVKRVGAVQGAVQRAFNELGTTDNLYTVSVFQNNALKDKNIGSLPAKLNRAFELVESSDLYPLNLAVEGGLGTVYVNAVEQSGFKTTSQTLSTGPFVDSTPLNALSGLYTTNNELTEEDGLRIRANYTGIANIFAEAAGKQRKDFMVILDPLRNVFVQGANTKITNSKKIYSPNAGFDPNPKAPGYVVSNFSQHIYWPIRHLYSTINTSYAAVYATWSQVLDPTSNRQIWVPFSGFAASTMANTDSNFQPWFAPAGFTRGIVTGVNDLGIYPKQKQRDQLYKVGINPVAFFPGEGFCIFGQKTLLKKPSAFDRINVRRMFLALENSVRDTIKFFVFEPNTLFTRTQIVNTLSPLFETAKNSEGIYDYLIVCDERNNTPDVIDNNELKVDIYVKPVRTAEFILVSFIATKTSQSFTELAGS